MRGKTIRTVSVILFVLSVISQNSYGKELSGQALKQQCGHMTTNSAAEILGVDSQTVKFDYSEEMKTCSYMVSFDKNISYSLYTASDASSARSEMANVAEGLKILVTCKTIDHVGDSAIYCSGDRAERLFVQNGNIWIDVRNPKGLDTMTRVAQTIFQ